MKHGFTLLEVLLVTAILVIMATVATGYYRNYVKSVELNQSANEILAELKFAREKAIAGEDNNYWGIHFENSTNDYYELFKNSSASYTGATIVETIFLHGGIIFTAPAEASSLNVIFNKIVGSAVAAQTVTLSSQGNTKTITVTAVGNIY